jgi:acetylornithine/succinyldiaminopimelate/putrescine aminotransferase
MAILGAFTRRRDPRAALRERDEKFLGRDAPAEDVVVAHSEGSWLVDPKGRRYVDFVMGWCVGNLGWGHQEIRKRLREFDGPAYVVPSFLYRGWTDLAELLVGIAPGRIRKAFRATGGTEAVEIALQAAMAHTGRRQFVSIEGSYHGNSIAAMSVGSSEFRERFDNLLPGCQKIAPPLDARAATRVERLLAGKKVAAFVMEPVVCNLGVVVPDAEFMRRVQDACARHGTVFVVDEVATGFGRTGRLFASEHFDLEPDVICLGKAISGGYGGLGATLTTEKVAKAMEERDSFYSTYGWHPPAVEAALASTRWLLRHRGRLLGNAKRMGAWFADRLSKMRFAHPARVRAKGLAIGVEFEAPGYAEEVVAAAREEGVLLSAISDRIFTLFPALDVDESVAEEGLGRLEKALEP